MSRSPQRSSLPPCWVCAIRGDRLAVPVAVRALAVPKPMTSGIEARGRFGKQDFVYLSDEDAYRCPAGETRRTGRSATLLDKYATVRSSNAAPSASKPEACHSSGKDVFVGFGFSSAGGNCTRFLSYHQLSYGLSNVGSQVTRPNSLSSCGRALRP
jgi:hypothetical protein